MRSDQIKKGVERAPNRSLLYALGYTEEELNRPLVGVVLSLIHITEPTRPISISDCVVGN